MENKESKYIYSNFFNSAAKSSEENIINAEKAEAIVKSKPLIKGNNSMITSFYIFNSYRSK